MFSNLHRPEHNPKNNPPSILKEHLDITGGRIVTRFPPEPNGYLHIGHAKAMNINFGYAKENNGWCYLRFDDTNPEKETKEYIESILEMMYWLGHKPHKITYASDYFDILYKFAIILIQKDKAYVCNQSSKEIKEFRHAAMMVGGKPTPSPCRNRPIAESLELFEGMKKGRFKEGEYTLRMKQNLDSPNPCMWDHVAYRIKYVPHPHCGDKWCIYPTYDYTHCICDSLENITHSLCSLEFGVRKESYDWLLETLNIYRSPQIEYSRLNLTYTILSKRKLIHLVQDGYVSGWDDPRLPTLAGLKRRGYTPEAINDFCNLIGVTRHENWQDIELLEECCRRNLESVNRKLAVKRPLKVTILNYPEDKIEYFDAPNHPTNKESGIRKIAFSKIIYIDQNDFRLTAGKNYHRLAPNKPVRLKYGYVIECVNVIKENGEIREIKAIYHPEFKGNPKGIIHWVNSNYIKLSIRDYSKLFNSARPIDNFLEDLNPNSLHVLHSVFAEESMLNLKIGDRIQLEREGYYIVDKDSTSDLMILNSIVPLKQDKNKT